MALTDTSIRNAKPRPKPFKLTDGGGLFLQVQPGGNKWWRYKYRFAGKQKVLALGVYPDVGLAKARKLHQEARTTLAAGNDPSEVKREAKRQILLTAENTFKAIAEEWWKKRQGSWETGYAKKIMSRLETHVLPRLGNRAITSITAQEFLSVLRVVEEKDALDLAKRLLQVSSQIFRYAVATGRVGRNPLVDLKGALKAAVTQHRAYIKEDELPEYLEKLEAYDGHPQTKLALKLLLLTFVRTGELRAATWTEFNFNKAEWRIPAERMKMRDTHIVPLSDLAIAVLTELKKLNKDRSFVFPNPQKPSSHMSENAMLYALYRMGYHSKATGHGFRSTASTILNENGFPPDVIERQLAHSERNGVRAAYNHAQYLPERRKMMQWWADFLGEVAKKKRD